MTYEMRMKDIREESLAEGEAKGSYSPQEIVELCLLMI